MNYDHAICRVDHQVINKFMLFNSIFHDILENTGEKYRKYRYSYAIWRTNHNRSSKNNSKMLGLSY